jgi:hypothetical protein
MGSAAGCRRVRATPIIRAIAGAKNELIDLENLSEAELEQLQERFHNLGEHARKLKERTRTALEKRRSAAARQRKAKVEAA